MIWECLPFEVELIPLDESTAHRNSRYTSKILELTEAPCHTAAPSSGGFQQSLTGLRTESGKYFGSLVNFTGWIFHLWYSAFNKPFFLTSRTRHKECNLTLLNLGSCYVIQPDAAAVSAARRRAALGSATAER